MSSVKTNCNLSTSPPQRIQVAEEPPFTTDNKFVITVENPQERIRNFNNGRNIFKLPNTFATSAIDGLNHQFQYTVTKMFTGTTDAGGVATISLPAGSGNVDFIDSSSNITVLATDLQTSNSNGVSPMSVATVQNVVVDQTNNVIKIDSTVRSFSNQRSLQTFH